MWEDLPAVAVNSWDLSQKELLLALQNYVRSDKFLSADFSRGWERLFLGYWRRRVLKDAGREKDLVRDPHSGEHYYLAWKYESKYGIGKTGLEPGAENQSQQRSGFGHLYWKDLPDEARAAAVQLGFSESSWDKDVYPSIFQKPVEEWSSAQLDAVNFLKLEEHATLIHLDRFDKE